MREAAIAQQIAFFNSPWVRFLIGHDPAETSGGSITVLAERDAGPERPAGHQSAADPPRPQGGPPVAGHELPGLNHLFQRRRPAWVEYATIGTTFDPVALDIMGDWILGGWKSGVASGRTGCRALFNRLRLRSRRGVH